MWILLGRCATTCRVLPHEKSRRTVMTTALPQTSLACAAPDPAALVARALDLLTVAAGALGPTPSSPGLGDPRVVTPAQALLELVDGRVEQYAGLGLPVADGRLVVISASEQVLMRLHSLAPTTSRSVEALRGEQWLVFIPGVPRTTGVDSADRESRRLVHHLQRCGVRGWRAGVSAAVTTPEDLAAAYRDASDALRLADPTGESTVFVDAEWARLTVARLCSVATAALPARSPLDVLAEHDDAHNSSFGASISAWLHANADMAAAARELGIHQNTLRYRVRRGAELAGLDLDDPRQRLVLLLTGSTWSAQRAEASHRS